ncbi:NAD-dependent epimerase/dehydratase family protein [Streptomyces qinglanensis]|uniref:NAD-dependent epimerase/dehydratase family protein n=1 Tax=Streptomyces qinglanensis TaxID=943816 RepID=UPI0037AB1F5D
MTDKQPQGRTSMPSETDIASTLEPRQPTSVPSVRSATPRSYAADEAVAEGSRPAGSSSAPKTALVTGAAGFIGSHLVDTLLARGWRVTGVDRRSPVSDPVAARNLERAMCQPGFRFEHADLTGPRTRELLDGVNVVFHLAAATGVRGSWDKKFPSYMQDNIAGTHHLIQECERAGVPRLVLASSSSVYGTAGVPSQEDGPVRPMSPYGVSKLAAERLALAYAARSSARTGVVALRYFTVYGPRQRTDMALSRMLSAVRTGQPMRLYGDGRQRRAFTFVSDAVHATVRAALTEESGVAVNVSGPVSVTVQALLDTVRDVTGHPVPFTAVSSRSGDPDRTEADPRLAHDILGFRPRIGLLEGVTRQWQWVCSLGEDTAIVGDVA